ncbi:hypothetical protein N5P18_01950 [Janibacter terrae]|uniref:Peptidase M11 gametolysin domain-containing protein n=1 Tax=Janibacter terrae TaxID=103817 RepID=A0ABZ2FHJ6_9MICO
MRARRVLPAILAAGVAFAAASTTSSAQPPSTASAPDALVRVSGTLLATSVERGSPTAWYAVRDGDRLVPVRGAVLGRVRPGSTVTVDVEVPATVSSAAAADRTISIPGLGGRARPHDLSPADLRAASDATPASADSAIGRATTTVPLAPGADPLPVKRLVSSTPRTAAAYTPATRKITYFEVTPRGITREPLSSSQASTQVSSSDAYWRLNSRSTLRLGTPIMRSHYASPYGCADNPFALWEDAANARGWVAEQDSTLALKFPEASYVSGGCSYGLGSVGMDPNSGGYVYFGSYTTSVLAHEVGHNMGLGHANAIACAGGKSDGAYSTGAFSGCGEYEYADYMDVMGPDLGGPPAMLSSPQARHYSTLESAARVLVGTGTTTVTLKPMAGTSGVRVAQITNAITRAVYLVEYRTAAGQDTFASTWVPPGVKVLRHNPYEGSSVLLDASPTGSPDDNSVLTVGRTLRSYDGRITITTLSATSTGATVRVTNSATLSPFTLVTAPRITGTKGVGRLLTASNGTWSPTPTSYSYRWKRNGVSISGATARTYTPTRSDAGRYLTVTVTARRSGYTSKSATSARVGIPIYNTTRPSISGTLRAGSTIAVTNGSWTPTPSTYAYQWYRNGVAISGATSKTYVVRSIDRGQLVKAKVVARRTGYSSGSIYSYSKTIAR